MVASKLGNPGCVVLTDGDEEAITLLETNLASEANKIDSEVTKTTVLRWGDQKQQSDFTYWCQSTWPDHFRNDDVSFDYIIAGDVMYKSELPALFFSTCRDLLADGGTLWLCHIPRAHVDHDLVVAQATKSGFHIEEFPCTDIEVEDAPLEDRERAKVYRITKT
jgi:predicted nicotinamide N-methyase